MKGKCKGCNTCKCGDGKKPEIKTNLLEEGCGCRTKKKINLVKLISKQNFLKLKKLKMMLDDKIDERLFLKFDFINKNENENAIKKAFNEFLNFVFLSIEKYENEFMNADLTEKKNILDCLCDIYKAQCIILEDGNLKDLGKKENTIELSKEFIDMYFNCDWMADKVYEVFLKKNN